jgi:multiple sugar transport system permease protein
MTSEPVARRPPKALLAIRAGAQRRSPRAALARLPLYLALAAGALAMLFPFVWMLSTSLTSDFQLFATPPQLIPRPLESHNYAKLAELVPIWRFALNSIIVAAISTLLQVLTSAMAAYAFARLRFRGRDALFLIYLATLMVPFQVTVVPLFIEMRYLGLVDSYPGLILPSIASAFGTFMLRQAFLTLPRELEEAAFVDGAGHWTVFTRIVLPLARPTLAAFGVFAFMASWNSFLWPLVIATSARHMTLPVGLANLHGQYTTAWNLVMAGTTISVVPILVVYLAAQKHIVRGFVLSGVKG